MTYIPISHDLFLSQQFYVRELLISNNMQDAKSSTSSFYLMRFDSNI